MDNHDEVMLEWSEAGIIKDVTYDDEGNVVSYDIDWDRFREYDPVAAEYFWQAHLEEVRESLDSLVDEGLLEMYFIQHEDGSIEEAYRRPDIDKTQE